MAADADLGELQRLRLRVVELEGRLRRGARAGSEPASDPRSSELLTRESQVELVRDDMRALSQSPAALLSMLELGEEFSRSGTLLWTASGDELVLSRGSRRIWGFDDTERLDAEALFSRIHPDDVRHIRRVVRRIRDGEKASGVEFRLCRPDDTTVHLSARAQPNFDERGAPSVVCVAVMDVTEVRQMESHLRQAQKLEVVGTLVGGIAHDFNNFLQIIGGHSGLLALDGALSPKARQSLTEIESALMSCRELIRRLLAFGRRQVSAPTLNDARSLIGRTSRMLERLIGEDIELRTRFGSDSCPIRIDPVEFEQIIVNLAVNARAAMPKGGRLHIDVRRETVDSERSAALSVSAGAYCCLTVQDTGNGIAADVLAHIFEPFFTTKRHGEGSGLGLAMVQGIVERARGAITASSVVGEGARFQIYLPLSTSEQSMPSQAVGG